MTLAGAHEPDCSTGWFFPDGSIRVLEWGRHPTREGATARAQEILDAGFAPGPEKPETKRGGIPRDLPRLRKEGDDLMPLRHEMRAADDLASKLAGTTNDFIRRVRERGGRVHAVQEVEEDGSLTGVNLRVEWPETPDAEDLLG